MTRQTAPGAKLTYSEAFAKSLAMGLPLIVWNGKAVCPSCVRESAEELVNFVGSVEGLPPDTLTVGVPEGGTMLKVGVISSWITGDQTHGHLPSIRRALRNWRERRQVTVPTASYQSTAFRGMSYGGGGMMMSSMSSGGACASCNTGGGLLRRR